MSEYDYQLGLVGAGNMGTGLIRGAIEAEIVSGQQVVFYDPDLERQEAVSALLGHPVADNNRQVVESAQVVVVAVKPQVIASVLTPLEPVFRDGQLVVSIAAGIRLARLAQLCGSRPALVRVMPNILCTIGEGAAAYSSDEKVSAQQREFVEALFGAVGTIVPVEERLLDAVTGVSGSGPAFVALFIEALVDGAVAAGLPREAAVQLAAQTTRGAAQWVLEGCGAGELREAVTSPGGTTAAGLRALEQKGLRSAAIEAVLAAARRSEELGQEAL